MNQSDLSRNAYVLCGSAAKKGYMRWWHSFSAASRENSDTRVFFIEYFIINPSLYRKTFLPGLQPDTLEHKRKPSYVMIKAGAFTSREGSEPVQLHAFYPIEVLKIAFNPLIIQAGECFYSENHIWGCVKVAQREACCHSYHSNKGQIEWDLEVCKNISFHTGKLASPLYCRLNALADYWHGEGIQTAYRGTVTLDGNLYDVIPETCYGYADKHWGQSFGKPWLRFASCCLTSAAYGRKLKNSAFALGTCRPVFLCFPLKSRLLLQLTYEGEDFECNYSRPQALNNCKWKVTQTQKRIIWQLVARNKDTIIKVTVSCLKEEMLELYYASAAGSKPAGPLLGGGSGTGTILLYRRTAKGKQLIDTITIEQALCEYQDSQLL